MTQSAKDQEPLMEEILASIRRIIADDDANKVAKAPEPSGTRLPPMVAVANEATPAARLSTLPPASPAPAAANSQDDIDAMLANLDATETAPPPSDVLNLTEEMAAPAPVAEPTLVAEPEPAAVFRTID